MAEKNHYQRLFDKANTYFASDRAEILPFVPPTVKTSLEFGCGQGDFSRLLKEKFKAETWAVELHKEAADIAAGKIDHVINMDAMESLDKLPDNHFDSIFLLDILEHLIDPYALLEKCRGKLSDDGVLIASIPNIRYYRALKNYIINGTWEYKAQGIMDITHLRFFTHSSIKEMFEKSGFQIVTLQGIHETRSSGFWILNTISMHRFWDARYKHFIAVVKKDKS